MENILDKILEEQGLNYEDLNQSEKDTYNKANFSIKKLTVGDIKAYVGEMKDSLALQLANSSSEEDLKNIFLKARLKNYILMEAFLLRPEKAEEALKKQWGETQK